MRKERGKEEKRHEKDLPQMEGQYDCPKWYQGGFPLFD
jgi:hypothetical protein